MVFLDYCAMMMLGTFSVSDNHDQKKRLSTTWLLIFRLEVANKKPLSTKPAIARIENSRCVKKI